MAELESMLSLWRELESDGRDYILATVIGVRGSSYRRPGARMLLAADGRRAGTVSGGCLEAEVVRRAWWLTASGPAIEDYSTTGDDEDERPYGSGCTGVVTILLERESTARPLLAALEKAFVERRPLAIATVLDGPIRAARALAAPRDETVFTGEFRDERLARAAEAALALQSPQQSSIQLENDSLSVWTDYRPARTGLWIFGAGDDAFPLLQMAETLGWFVAVADGRAHLASRQRFPGCDALLALNTRSTPAETRAALDLRAGDAAVLMTHSFDQDAHLLAALLSEERLPVAYTGVLGSAKRTRQLLDEVARLLSPANPLGAQWIEDNFEQLYSPMGLDLGNESPAEIALSILAEVKKVLAGGSGESMRKVRAQERGERPDRGTQTSCLPAVEGAIR